MTKKIFIVLYFFIFLSLNATSQDKSAYQEKYVGDVKSVTCIEIFEGDSKRDPKDTVKYGYEYNKNGYEILLWSPYPFDTGIVKMYHTYDDLDNYIEELWIYGNDTIGMTHFFYNEFNKPIQGINFSIDSSHAAEFYYYYNEQGLETLFVQITDNEDTLFQVKTYDSNGRCIKMTERQGDHLKTTSTVYDSNGNIIAEQFVDHKYNRNSNTYTKKYNQDNKAIEFIGYDANGAVTSMYIYEYNEHGDKISWHSYDTSGKVIYFEKTSYDYDPIGNWIVKRAYKGKKLFYTEYRTFTYY